MYRDVTALSIVVFSSGGYMANRERNFKNMEQARIIIRELEDDKRELYMQIEFLEKEIKELIEDFERIEGSGAL